MNSMTSLCVVILVAFCVNQIYGQSAGLIGQACGATRYKDLCETTFKNDPSSKTADIHGLAKIALNAAAKQSKAVQAKVKTLQATAKDKLVVQALKDCAENYDGANEHLADSLKAIGKKRYDDVNTWVSAAMTNGDSCEEGFKHGTSKLTADNEKFTHLCSNVLAISNKAAGK